MAPWFSSFCQLCFPPRAALGLVLGWEPGGCGWRQFPGAPHSGQVTRRVVGGRVRVWDVLGCPRVSELSESCRKPWRRGRARSGQYLYVQPGKTRRGRLGAVLCATELIIAAVGALTFVTDVGLRKGDAVSTYLTFLACFGFDFKFFVAEVQKRFH